MTKSALAFQHVAFEDLGSLEPLLIDRGFAIDYVNAPIADFSTIDPTGPDLVVVLGGPIGVYETDEYPFLDAEIRFLTERIAASKPTLGLCLGCQLIARALGARVYPSGSKEIGWAPVTLSTEGEKSCLASLADGPVLHWHGDTFDLPPGTRHLASTRLCANQAFALGDKVLALQFHPEVTASGLEPWFVGHTCEIAGTPGIDVPSLRSETAKSAPGLEAAATRMFGRWLDSAGL
jgi:GMP synthase (glutamine-hydrolysing)